jgi:hypothetical protein
LLTKSGYRHSKASPIKAVILDYGEVICFPPGEKEFAAMAAYSASLRAFFAACILRTARPTTEVISRRQPIGAGSQKKPT